MELRPSKPNLRPVIQIDAEKCVTCHRCISVCPVKFCNNASADVIEINHDLCIGCGTCIDVCTHEARIGLDDLAEFQAALVRREPIVAIVAPAIAANFPNTYLRLNGWLKSIGVKAVFDVSFGAELTVKSYLEWIKTTKPKCVIAQPCPALVTFIEVYHPELLAYLAPADSPMLHTMRMVREYYPQYRNAKFAVLSPCLAKRREFDEVGIGNFNVTYRSLAEHLRKEGVDLAHFPETDYDNPPAERAVLFSTPGGLVRTAQREAPEIVPKTRKIEGAATVYHYLTHLHESIRRGESPLLVDCLSCEMGCNGGPGTMNRGKSFDEVESLIEEEEPPVAATVREPAVLGETPGCFASAILRPPALETRALRTFLCRPIWSVEKTADSDRCRDASHLPADVQDEAGGCAELQLVRLQFLQGHGDRNLQWAQRPAKLSPLQGVPVESREGGDPETPCRDCRRCERRRGKDGPVDDRPQRSLSGDTGDDCYYRRDRRQFGDRPQHE